MPLTAVCLSTVAVALLACGCRSGGGKSASGGAGGAGLGGTSATGGTSTTVTPSASGGVAGSGGLASTGGLTTTGGTTAAQSTGGVPGAGGASASGGATSSGGATPSGGSASAGGVSGRGGATSSGGAPTTGGATATSAGGKAAGGASASGGSVSTGGATGGTTVTCPTTAANLKTAAACTNRLVGVALSTQHLGESAYATAAKEFNYVTPENEMKWDQIEPARGQFSWSAADQIVSFASSNGMKVKGHALVWHNQLPSWASGLGSAADARAVMVAHIKSVMQHYKGKVQAWDVVNEAIALDGNGLRDYVFPRYLGETFIDEAFKAAREADADAKLYYNDYNCEGTSLKSTAVYELVKRMKERNVPFDGVGLQLHYGKPNLAPTATELAAVVQGYAELGLDVLISEMDVHVCAGLTPTQQQTLYHDLVAVCVGQPRCVAVTFWGITDQYSWLNDEDDLGCAAGQKPLGLLWDDAFKKKPAYTGVLNALLAR